MKVKTRKPTLLKLDLGCGTRKMPGYHGVDIRKFDDVDTVLDLRQPWPWEDGSVEEVESSHFVEHLTWPERVHFFNELCRVLKAGGTARIVTPHWSHACAYGDPTHQWPPMSEWMVYYLNKTWRTTNAPHTDYTCDFDYQVGGSWDEKLNFWAEEKKVFAMQNYINSHRDLIFTLTKR